MTDDRAENNPHYIRAVLDKIHLSLSAIERYVAALPSAADVDIEKVKRELRDEITTPLENVRLVTRHHWSDLQVDRIFALSRGEQPPKEEIPKWE